MATDKLDWNDFLSRLENLTDADIDIGLLEEFARLGTPPDSAIEDRAVIILNSLSNHQRWQIRQGVAEILFKFPFVKVKDTLTALRADSTRWVKQSADASYKKLRVSSTIDKRDRKWDYTVSNVKKLKNKYPDLNDDLQDDILKLCMKTGELYFEEVTSQALHQVNTLMFVLSDSVDALESNLKKIPKFSSEASESLTDIKRHKENLRTLFESLMQYARPWEGQVAMENAANIISDAVDAAKVTATNGKASNIQWNISCNESLRLECDRMRIADALKNLIVNSLEAMPTGGQLSVEAKATANGRLQFVITDAGCGMADDKFESNKRPGVTSKHQDTKSSWHSGLGLPYAVKVIELGHEGRIIHDAEITQGTRLIVEVPIVREVKNDCQ